MTYEKRSITAGSIYHVLNRGVDKRRIFWDERDYFRFIHNLFEFNDSSPVNSNFGYFLEKHSRDSMDFARLYIKSGHKHKRKLLVKILAFCLMPNHYHLLLQPIIDNGVEKFMRKLNMGFAQYINKRHQRSGALFQGRYKSIAVVSDSHLTYLPYYIHLNPLDLKAPEWRDKSLKNFDQAWKFLNQYRWSSHLDYMGEKNFSSITSRAFLIEQFGGSKSYTKGLKEWLKDLSNIENIREVALE